MNDDPAMMALLYPLQTGLVIPAMPVLAVNAVPIPGMAAILPPGQTHICQWWAGPARALEGTGYPVDNAFGDLTYPLVLLRAPRQVEEARFLLARCWAAVAPGGAMIVAAANDAGGRRLVDYIAPHAAGFSEWSKHKCRIVALSNKAGATFPPHWLEQGDWQVQAATGLRTRPGLFSWDRVDPATALLLRVMDITDLSGAGADLGCGIGVIADHVLTHGAKVQSILCADADARAIEAAAYNLRTRHPARKASTLWADLSHGALPQRGLDFIVTNPPFHSEKKQAVALGCSFITLAARALRRGGVLWMVANAHLPYEEILQKDFSSFSCITREGGFKILRAVR